MNNLQQFRQQLYQADFSFAQALSFIHQHYSYTPCLFSNNGIVNPAGENEGSCKILAFAVLENLSKQEALLAYGEHYRHVLATPAQTDHANIRALLKGELTQVIFQQPALVPHLQK